jgi:hypothetical protein
VSVGNSSVRSIIDVGFGLPNLPSIRACMKEYQAVVVKLTRHTREDEDTLTDLLNERSRGGWEPALMSRDDQRLIILFQRSAVAEA